MTTLPIALLATTLALTIGCGGGDPDACRRADEIAGQIRKAALEDGIATAGLCASAEAMQLVVSAAREAEYVAACHEFAVQQKKCDGD